MLGNLCYDGRLTSGVRQYKEARYWFDQGAKLKDTEASYKLADMLLEGIGGPPDPQRAWSLYLRTYLYCRCEFEDGKSDSRFADLALRMGILRHEGRILEKSNYEALSYFLEAKYAIKERECYHLYGDDEVEKYILHMIGECDEPDFETQREGIYLVGLGRVPLLLMSEDNMLMTIDVEYTNGPITRLVFRRKRRDGKKPWKILWSIPPAMRCIMTEFVVIYGHTIRRIWTRNPGEQVLCDEFRYRKETNAYLFYLDGKLQCELQGGEYMVPLDEFWLTQISDSRCHLEKRVQ